MNSARKYWETCRSNYAHLKMNWQMFPQTKRLREVRAIIQDNYKLNNKTIVDYGCGAGWLGLYLFKHHGIEKYIGIDIADRSLHLTREKMEGYNIETHRTHVDFNKLDADVFITMSCIQHFPDLKYLRLFLKNLDNSGIKLLILHIRFGRITSSNGDYKELKNIGTSCLTNDEHVSENLSNYELLYATRGCKIAESQWLLYEMKNEL